MNTNVGRTKGALKLEDRSIISQLIYKWRLSKGWTQAEAGDAVGLKSFAHFEVLPKGTMSISFMLANKLKEFGLDLSQTPGIEISAVRKGRLTQRTSEKNLNAKTDEFQNYFDRARKAFDEAKEKMEGKVKSFDEKIKALYTKIEEFEVEIKELESKKAEFLKKMHKIDLSNDNIDQCLGKVNEGSTTIEEEQTPSTTQVVDHRFDNLLPKQK